MAESDAICTEQSPSPGRLAALRGRLTRLTVDQKFLAIGGLISIAGMFAVGLWTSARIEASVLRNSALSAAVYMESFIAPLSQELSLQRELTDEARARVRRQLDRLVVDETHPGQIVSVKIWVDGGLVAFATDESLVGQRFEPSENLRRAWRGELVAEFDELDNEESAVEQARGIPLLEVYNPVHSVGTGKIIAVAEFYQDASELEHDLYVARMQAVGLVGLVWSMTFLASWGVVRAAGRTIERQNKQLERRIAEVTRISEQNRALRDRAAEASRAMTTLNERLLRRIGAELHDGPAQAISLAMLRLDRALSMHGSTRPEPGEEDEATTVRKLLDEAISTIRSMSRGLILPELQGASSAEVVRMAVENHELRTGAEVDIAALGTREPDPPGAASPLPPAHAIAVYRFVQEALLNAHRHAQGAAIRVDWALEGGELVVSVVDEGPGMGTEDPFATGRLGLVGLRERAESLGGRFELHSGPGRGMKLVLRLPLLIEGQPR